MKSHERHGYQITGNFTTCPTASSCWQQVKHQRYRSLAFREGIPTGDRWITFTNSQQCGKWLYVMMSSWYLCAHSRGACLCIASIGGHAGNVIAPFTPFVVSTRWHHDRNTISALLALCEGRPQIICEFQSQKVSNAKLWCFRLTWTNSRFASPLRHHCVHVKLTGSNRPTTNLVWLNKNRLNQNAHTMYHVFSFSRLIECPGFQTACLEQWAFWLPY